MTSLGRRPGRPGLPATPLGHYAWGPTGQPTPEDTAALAAETHRQDVQNEAANDLAYLDLIKRGPETCVDVIGRQVNLAAVTPPINLVQFTVPGAMIFRLTGIGFEWSDPYTANWNPITYLPWRILVDGTQPVNVTDSLGPIQVPLGGIFEPMQLNGFWVQAGSVVSIAIVTLGAYTIMQNAAGRLQGELYKFAGLKLGREV